MSALTALMVTSLALQARPSTLTGHIEVHPAWKSDRGSFTRTLRVWLPPSYRQTNRRYPVMVVLDGQNVFDGGTSFIPGQEWGLDETAQALTQSGLMEEVILVAVDNASGDRIHEYAPSAFRQSRGEVSKFGDVLENELLPWIRNQYRADADPRRTGIMGSSLGGLATIALGARQKPLFGRFGIVSPSVWWDDRMILRTAETIKPARDQRIWLCIGGKESATAVADTKALRGVLIQQGWRLGINLAYYEDPFGEHNEAAWARRAGEILMFLYPPRR